MIAYVKYIGTCNFNSRNQQDLQWTFEAKFKMKNTVFFPIRMKISALNLIIH